LEAKGDKLRVRVANHGGMHCGCACKRCEAFKQIRNEPAPSWCTMELCHKHLKETGHACTRKTPDGSQDGSKYSRARLEVQYHSDNMQRKIKKLGNTLQNSQVVQCGIHIKSEGETYYETRRNDVLPAIGGYQHGGKLVDTP
jgi:hypothetical protein